MLEPSVESENERCRQSDAGGEISRTSPSQSRRPADRTSGRRPPSPAAPPTALRRWPHTRGTVRRWDGIPDSDGHSSTAASALLAAHGTNREAGDRRTTNAGFCHARRLTNRKEIASGKSHRFGLLYFWDFDAALNAKHNKTGALTVVNFRIRKLYRNATGFWARSLSEIDCDSDSGKAGYSSAAEVCSY